MNQLAEWVAKCDQDMPEDEFWNEFDARATEVSEDERIDALDVALRRGIGAPK